MAKNQFVNEYGELSNEILLNVAEILTLRLPEGSGEYFDRNLNFGCQLKELSSDVQVQPTLSLIFDTKTNDFSPHSHYNNHFNLILPERITASKWVKKFNVCEPTSYQQYLSLFVSCLTKQLLVDPFDAPPKDMTSQWHNFGKVYNQEDINNAVIHRLYKDSFTPPYQLDLSSDLKEYVAFQEVPFFGAHFYYAFSSRDKIDKWTKFNKMNVPKNLVEILRKDDPVESPIKGRLFPRPQSRAAEPTKITFKPKSQTVLSKKKPDWEDLIEQEEAESEPDRKQPTIVIPTDVSVKNIPPALQRRMAKAEQESEFYTIGFLKFKH